MTTAARPRVPPGAVLAIALLGMSFAAPLVRLSHAHPIAIAAGRLAVSLVVIAVMLAVTGEWRQWRQLGRTDLLTALAAGVLLALHFWSWNASVALTTVAASVVLVNLHPVIVAAASALWLREVPSRRQLGGIALALVGALVVASGDWDVSAAAPHALLGDMLALVGALTVALYYTIGRRLRQTLALWPYVGLVYGACLVVLIALGTILGVPLVPANSRELSISVGLALGPMLLGHTGMNWALRYLPAYVVALTTLGEPVGATLLAMGIPGIAETPSLLTIAGGALVLSGVLVAIRACES